MSMKSLLAIRINSYTQKDIGDNGLQKKLVVGEFHNKDFWPI